MNRRHFLKTLAVGSAGAAISTLPRIAPEPKEDQLVRAPQFGYTRCPECGCAMARIGVEGKMFITCCDKTYKEPTILLERIL